MSQTVLYNADVYSSVDPFANAIAFAGPEVLWVGGDEAATVMDGRLIDCQEDFITPGLTTAALDLGHTAVTGTRLLAAGIVSAHVLGTSEQLTAFASSAGVLRVTAYEFTSDGSAAPGHRPALRASVALELSPQTAPEAFVVIDTLDELRAMEARLSDSTILVAAQRAAWRLFVTAPITEADIAALGSWGLGITIAPSTHDYPIAQLLAAGAQLSFSLDPESPWATLRAAVFGPDGTSGRAAFNAVTRFAHRAIDDVSGGVLAPGASADLVRWRIGNLVVQAADERVAAWSTDPRSGTAGLPDLSPDQPLPLPVTVYVNGSPID
jgi:hypothetical protein